MTLSANHAGAAATSTAGGYCGRRTVGSGHVGGDAHPVGSAGDRDRRRAGDGAAAHRAPRSTRTGDERRAALAEVVAAAPRSLEAWARLGDAGRDVIERYAAYRVGYHRGLDTLRANGWRGSGYVRWEHPGNRGFLRALAGPAAHRRGDRRGTTKPSGARQFLRQLDPGVAAAGAGRA